LIILSIGHIKLSHEVAVASQTHSAITKKNLHCLNLFWRKGILCKYCTMFQVSSPLCMW